MLLKWTLWSHLKDVLFLFLLFFPAMMTLSKGFDHKGFLWISDSSLVSWGTSLVRAYFPGCPLQAAIDLHVVEGIAISLYHVWFLAFEGNTWCQLRTEKEVESFLLNEFPVTSSSQPGIHTKCSHHFKEQPCHKHTVSNDPDHYVAS